MEGAKGRVPRRLPSPPTDTFDVSIDGASTVSLAYSELALFTFNGPTDKVHFKY